jgi:cytochrome c biogenesis protein CcmG, thiol:disulfide interchange protein DsbE
MHIRFLLPLVIFGIMVIFFWYGLGKDPSILPMNKPLPVFSSTSLLTDRAISNATFRDNIIVLNSWATWCTVCKIEHPLLIDISKNKDVKVYGLNYKDNRTAALNYLKEMGNPYRDILYDPQGKLAMRLGIYGTPETFLIDKKGIVRHRFVGPITLEVFENDLLPKIKKIAQED